VEVPQKALRGRVAVCEDNGAVEVRQDHKDPPDCQDCLVLKGRQAIMVNMVNMVSRDHPVNGVPLALKAHMDLRGIRAFKVHWDRVATVEIAASEVSEAIAETAETEATGEKEEKEVRGVSVEKAENGETEANGVQGARPV
jgi:hypothetical protein